MTPYSPAALISVAAGGSVGAVLRYLVSQRAISNLHTGDFPVGTFAVNLAGSFLLGLLTALVLADRGPDTGWVLFLGTGLCGALTTFSTFSVESFVLLRGGHGGMAATYLLTSLLACGLAVALAFSLFGESPQ